MQRISWRIPFYLVSLALLVMYGTWWARMIANAADNTSTDFISLYSVARIAQQQGLPMIYDVQAQQNAQQAVIGAPLANGQVLLFIHPPSPVFLLVMVVNADYTGSFVRWVLVLLALYLLSAHLLTGLLFPGGPVELRLAWTVSVLVFFPLFISLWQGQDTAILFLGCVLWCMGVLKKQDWLIALGLTLVAVRPHMGVALALPLWFTARRAWWLSVLCVGALVAVSMAVLNFQGVWGLLHLIRISSAGDWFGMRPEVMLNGLGLLLRVVGVPGPALVSLLGWVLYGVGLAGICWLWWRSRQGVESLVGLTLLMVVLTAPHLHLHDLTVLILPVLLIGRDVWLRSGNPYVVLIPVGVSVFLLAGFLLGAAYFVFPYLLYGALAWFLWTGATSERSGVR